MLFDYLIVSSMENGIKNTDNVWTEDSGPLGKFKMLTAADMAGFKVVN